MRIRKRSLKRRICAVQKTAIANGLNNFEMKQFDLICDYNHNDKSEKFNKRLIFVLLILFLLPWILFVLNNFMSARCLVPSNYLIWEATRPLANCAYCENVTKPIVLYNVTRHEFNKYAYSTGPIIVKNAIKSWRATKEFNYKMFKRLYEETGGSYESLDDGCQFLNFKTDLFSLKEVFNMPEERVKNEPGQKPWYVGWGNCHPEILSKVRQYYNVPDFLPSDAEFSGTENIFFGYEIGAVMHLDYISRLMWQGQVSGNKIWSIAPVPECDHVCNGLEFYVEKGDIVFLDTRIWYHSTRIPAGEFSLTVQSEYG